jgi:hypothetical protein
MYLLTSSAGQGGTISPSGSNPAVIGSSQTFTITPASGYAVSSVTVDGASAGTVSTYTFSNITANHTIAASFTTSTGTDPIITASAGTGGTISPSGSVSTTSGSNQTFYISPVGNNVIGSVIVDGASVGAVSTYTFTNIKAPHTITATFVPSMYLLTSSAGQGGTISPSGSNPAVIGSSQTFTITPNPHYWINYLLVDGKQVAASSSNTYTFTDVTANHTIRAVFQR